MPVTSTSKPAPQLHDDMVIRAVCGLRPCRHGGLRLDSETIGSKLVVHHYGHGGCGVTIAPGTTEIVCRAIGQEADPGEAIAVLGGGVVGLLTARKLAAQGHRVCVYSDKLGTETTSVLAGALWLPVGVEFGTSEQDQHRKLEILRDSLDAFRSLDADRYGIEELEVFEPAGSHTEEGLFEPGLIEEPVPIDAFPFPCQAEPGRKFKTLFIHTPRFLRSLIEDLGLSGVRFEQRRFSARSDLGALPERIMVNCLALGSRTVFEDNAVYSARGVLVHLKPQRLGYCVHDGYKYMFPREDALVLGGCFQPGRSDTEPDEAMVREILDHHRRFFGGVCGVG